MTPRRAIGPFLGDRREAAGDRPRPRGRWFAVAGIACAAALATLAEPARALADRDAGALVTAPPRWRTDPEQATALAQRFAATAQFGGLPVATAAEAYVADRPGVALFATRATASLPDGPAQAARVARAALDELRASPRRAGLSGGTAEEQSWDERVDPDRKQVTATLTWRDPAGRTVETARLVIASDGKRIAAVTGECLASDAADPALVAACRAALATLDPGMPAASRVVLVPASVSEVAAAPPGDTVSTPARPPARLDDGSRIVFPPTVIPQDRREADSRPMYLGAGLIALALLFWWSRRQRDRFEHEESATRRQRRRREPEDDGDDLHAAARSEPPGNRQDDDQRGPSPDGQGERRDDGQHDRRAGRQDDKQDP